MTAPVQDYYRDFAITAYEMFLEAEQQLGACDEDRGAVVEGLRRRARVAGKCAAVCLSDVIDYCWHDRAPGTQNHSSLGSYRQSLIDQCPEIGLVIDIADAQKHSRLRNEDRFVFSATSVSPEHTMWDEMRWDEASWGEQICVVSAKSGERRSLRALLDEVKRHWDLHFAPVHYVEVTR